MYINIELERQRRFISKKKLADILDITPEIYNAWILRLRPIPAKKLIELSRLFGLSVDYLLAVPQVPQASYACFSS